MIAVNGDSTHNKETMSYKVMRVISQNQGGKGMWVMERGRVLLWQHSVFAFFGVPSRSLAAVAVGILTGLSLIFYCG